METIVFGPVPSRRLGRSFGINNVKPKSCSYSCVYCQVGKTTDKIIKRKAFYKPAEIFRQVKSRIETSVLRNEVVDYLTFVPDGEPTLDLNLGIELDILEQTGISRAVITNGSLVWREDVKEDLLKADLVSFKIDAIHEKLWKRINRPHKDLNLNTILEGIAKFSREFKGKIISETMLLDQLDYGCEFEIIADFLKGLKQLDKAYIAVPTRPPTERWVKPVKELALNAAFEVFAEKLGFDRVEYLVGYEGNAFACTGNVREDLLSIMTVHPMRHEAVKALLEKSNADWTVIEILLHEGKLLEIKYQGNVYYIRALNQAFWEGS